MKITTYTKKDGSTVYRTGVYLGIDSVTGKKVKTTVSARTKRELDQKARRKILDFEYRLGHANISMTLDVYSHLSQDKEKEAVTYYEKALSGL